MTAEQTVQPDDVFRNRRLERIAIRDLKKYPRNARTHSAQQVALIAQSMRTYGWTQPLLVDEANEIIAGHGRLEAAKSIGLTEVSAIRILGLSEAQKRALVIQDNQLAITGSGWDPRLLAEEMRGIQFDIDAGDLDLAVADIGFTDAQLQDIFSVLDAPPVEEEPREITVKDEPAVCKAGERWMLGPHHFTPGGGTLEELRAADGILLAFERATRLDAKLADTGQTFKARAEELGIKFQRTEMRAQKAKRKE